MRPECLNPVSSVLNIAAVFPIRAVLQNRALKKFRELQVEFPWSSSLRSEGACFYQNERLAERKDHLLSMVTSAGQQLVSSKMP